MSESKFTPLFSYYTNKKLIELLHNIPRKKCEGYLWDEIYAHETRPSKESQFKFLNKLDLVKTLYACLIDEIKEIDDTPLEDVPKLLNREWSIPELKDRVNFRMKEGI